MACNDNLRVVVHAVNRSFWDGEESSVIRQGVGGREGERERERGTYVQTTNDAIATR